MSKEDYINKTTEKLVLNELNKKYGSRKVCFFKKLEISSPIFNNKERIKFFFTLNMKIIKKLKSLDVSETFDKFVDNFNVLKKENILSSKELNDFHNFIKEKESISEDFYQILYKNMISIFNKEKKELYDNLIRIEEEQKIQKIIENF